MKSEALHERLGHVKRRALVFLNQGDVPTALVSLRLDAEKWPQLTESIRVAFDCATRLITTGELDTPAEWRAWLDAIGQPPDLTDDLGPEP